MKKEEKRRSTAELRRYLWGGIGRPYGADWRTDFPEARPARPSLNTYDELEALQEINRRLDELEAGRQGKDLAKKSAANPLLEEYAERHLRMLDIEDSTRERYALALDNVTTWMNAFLSRPTRVRDIDGELVSEYIAARKGHVARQTIRNELYPLSGLMRRAVQERKAEVNPVRDHMDIPKVGSDGIEREIQWLEIGEAARTLGACQGADVRKDGRVRLRLLHALVATFLLTGGRRDEVFGLDASDVDLENNQVIFRANRWRALKRDNQKRIVPLWPQLKTILAKHLDGRTTGLVFSLKGKKLGASAIKKGLATVQAEAKIEKHLHPHIFRHTYTAARLQTMDGDHPVSVYTVAAELGHQDLSMMERHYGHVMKVRHRSKVVEYVEAKVVAIGGRKRA